MMNICELLLDVITEFYENDSRARTFGTDTELYHSEIHMLQCIAERPDLHISGLARLLDVTRGAASQTAKRLERKGMIIKEASPSEKYNAPISDILAGADAGQRQFLSDFLRRLEQKLKQG